jgi:hypothetical protein
VTDEATTLLSDAPAAPAAEAAPPVAEPAVEAPAAGAPAPEGEAPAAEGEKAEDDKPVGAPEAYEDFDFGEGVEVDAAVASEFKDLAKELNLPQAEAQRVAALGAKMAQSWAAQVNERHAATVAEWGAETQADKEIGGDKLPQNLAAAKKAIDTFGTPELRQLLDMTGMGNHPEVVRVFAKAGLAISEDTFVGSKAQSAPADRAKAMYPNSNLN